VRKVLAAAFVPVSVAVLVAVLAACTWVWVDRGSADEDGDRTAAAAATGREAAGLFFSLDPTDVDAGIDQLLAISTGTFATDYAAQRDTLTEQVESKGLTVTATVPAGGVALEHVTDTVAQVLVAVDTSTALRDGSTELDNYRVRVRLALVDDRWRVSGVEQVG